MQGKTDFVFQGQDIVEAYKYERKPRDTIERGKQNVHFAPVHPTSYRLSHSLAHCFSCVSRPLPSTHSAALGSCLASCCLCPDKVLI